MKPWRGSFFATAQYELRACVAPATSWTRSTRAPDSTAERITPPVAASRAAASLTPLMAPTKRLRETAQATG